MPPRFLLPVALLLSAAQMQTALCHPSGLHAAESTGQGGEAAGRAIALFESRVREGDFLNRTILAQLLIERARRTGDPRGFARAEAVLRAALEARPDHAPAKLQLCAALAARHAFAECLALADEVLAEHPGDPAARAARGDALLELGRYDEAEAEFIALAERAPSPAADARLGRIAELRGDPERAIVLLERAAAHCAEAGRDASWFEFRLGDLRLKQGEAAAAEQHFTLALRSAPDHRPSILGAARAHVALGQTRAARTILEGLGSDPAALAALADIHAASGDLPAAQQAADRALEAMEEDAAHAGDAAHLRELALFLADHDREPARAVALARRDLEQRSDVFAWDALAWSLHKAGDHQDAAAASAEALRLGTRDARLLFHAGMIRNALGDREAAIRHLTAALELKSGFSLRQSAIARQTLADLGAAPERPRLGSRIP